MVDVLGWCREVEEAKALAMSMHMEANSMVWLILLSSCKVHSNLDVAERAAKRILEMDLIVVLHMCCSRTCMHLREDGLKWQGLGDK
jgi:hypothetical protein